MVKKEEAVLRFEWRDIAHTTALFRGVKTEEVGCRLRPDEKDFGDFGLDGNVVVKLAPKKKLARGRRCL